MKWFWFFLILVGCAGESIFATPLNYTVVDLGTLGGTISYGSALNSTGQVAGSAYVFDDQGQNAFISGPNGAAPLRDLYTLGGGDSFGAAVNAAGSVAGTSRLSDESSYHAFFSLANGGGLSDLETLGGTNSYGTGLNGAGRVVGYSLIAGNSTTHAFISSSNGGLIDLGTLTGGTISFALAMNASGQVTGYSGTTSGYNHAFIADANGTLRDLGTLGGRSSFGLAINDSGQVVGRSEVSAIGQHAFRNAPNGGPLLDLGTLGGYSSFGEGINSSGSVTGYSYLSDNSTQRAFLYSTKFGMLDLNSLIGSSSGWVLKDATAINDQGQIAGTGTLGSLMHAFLLKPILPSVQITSVARLTNGHLVVQGIGTAYQTFTVEATSDLASDFTPYSSVVAASDGSMKFEDASSANFTRRFYRFVYP